MSTATKIYYRDEEIYVPELKRVHNRDEVSCEVVFTCKNRLECCGYAAFKTNEGRALLNSIQHKTLLPSVPEINP